MPLNLVKRRGQRSLNYFFKKAKICYKTSRFFIRDLNDKQISMNLQFINRNVLTIARNVHISTCLSSQLDHVHSFSINMQIAGIFIGFIVKSLIKFPIINFLFSVLLIANWCSDISFKYRIIINK